MERRGFLKAAIGSVALSIVGRFYSAPELPSLLEEPEPEIAGGWFIPEEAFEAGARVYLEPIHGEGGQILDLGVIIENSKVEIHEGKERVPDLIDIGTDREFDLDRIDVEKDCFSIIREITRRQLDDFERRTKR